MRECEKKREKERVRERERKRESERGRLRYVTSYYILCNKIDHIAVW